ncbi:HAD hydrolase-like protein [Streptomyces sp. NPDC005483]|uniref:HAD hydrolase-like protein n=1 Tax=Streptomyces sp. NPDC005483 TaxID=3154882 RepID=UPI0033AA50E4
MRKSAARLFELAAAGSGTQLTAGDWMSGDNPETDIAGAAAAGLRTIWVRGRDQLAGLTVPHHTADGVVEPVDYLLANSTL